MGDAMAEMGSVGSAEEQCVWSKNGAHDEDPYFDRFRGRFLAELGLCRDGEAVKFPLVCPHCNVTYWYAPGDSIEELPEICLRCILRLREAGGEDEGTRWWKSFCKEQGPRFMGFDPDVIEDIVEFQAWKNEKRLKEALCPSTTSRTP